MSFPASSFQAVPPPNYAAYSDPGLGMKLGQMIGQVPQQFMQGRENARQVQMQDMFKDGIPLNEKDQSPDINEIIKRGARVGGMQFVQQMLPFLFKNAAFHEAMKPLPGENEEPDTEPAPRGASPAATGPAGIAGTANPPVDPNAPTINKIIRTAGLDWSPRSVASLARQIGINPDAALTPEQVAKVNDALESTATPSRNQETVPPSKSASAAEDAANTTSGDAAGNLPASGVAGAPGPAAGGSTMPVPKPPAAPFMGGRQAQAGPQEGGAAGNAINPETLRQLGVPANYLDRPGVYVQGQLKRAAELDRRAAALETYVSPGAGKGFTDQAAGIRKNVEKIQDEIGKAGQLTPEQKTARDVTVQAQKTFDEVRKGDIATGEKTFKGLQEAGTAGRMGNEKLDVMRTQMSDPNFFSGAGNELVKKFRQWSVSLGGDPRAAEPMEEFHKTALDLLNEKIRSLAAGGVSRIQLQEIRNLKESIASLGISPASNRYLTEELYRIHKSDMDVANLARQYRAQHQYLDSGWETVRDRYYAEHPLFSREEIADPRLISPPYLPRAIAADPAKHATWLRQQGIKPGDPIRTDDPKRPIVWAK